MPSRPTLAQWCLVELYWTGYDKLLSNLFWFDNSLITYDPGFPYSSEAHSLVLALQTYMAPVMDASIISPGGYVEFHANGGTYGLPAYISKAGTAPSAVPMPEDVAVVVQKNGDSSGPTHRGRWFFSGVSNIFQSGSYLNNGGTTAFAALGVNLKTPIASVQSGDYNPATFSPKTGNLTVITACTVVHLLATARRRRPRF